MTVDENKHTQNVINALGHFECKKTKNAWRKVQTNNNSWKRIKLKIFDKEIITTTSHKYLGKFIEEEAKISEDLESRIAKGKVEANDCIYIINREQMNTCRIKISLNIFETSVVSTVLFEVESWVKLKEKEMRTLNNV